ncbi:MAG: Rieske (2Fe-2S) protein, partial [Chlorobi bacterium]|nr:Rieske (2Fe-2S) protein [Chlorobiota bacterium]
DVFAWLRRLFVTSKTITDAEQDLESFIVRDAPVKILPVKGTSGIGVVLSGSALSALLCSCESDTTKPSPTGQNATFDVTTAPELATIGAVIKRTFGSNNGGNPVFIVRTGETTFLVLSSRCSHQGCEVNEPSQIGGKLVCPCHLAEYDPLTGQQNKPPSGSRSTGPLQKFAATFNPQTNILTITF